MGLDHLAKNDIFFSTEVEKQVHKKLSGMRYGSKIEIDLSIASSKQELSKAIKKSARYNCMDIKIQWPRTEDNNFVTISVE